MAYTKIIFNSLKESLANIWKNKFLFAALFILQIIFFVVFTALTYVYIPKIIESSKAISDYLSKQKFDDASTAQSILEKKSILGDDPLLISRNFKEIIKNFRLYLIYVFILLVISTSISWSMTFKIINKKNAIMKIFSKIFIIAFFYFTLIFLFFFSLTNISIIDATTQASMLFVKIIVFLIFSTALLYFMFISLASINHTELNNIVQKTLIIGVRKVHYILALYFINLSFFALSAVSLIYFLEKNLFFLFLSMILVVFSFVFGRAFMINVTKHL